MPRGNKRTVWSVMGVILVLFGLTGSIPILLNREYIWGLPATGLAVIVGVLLVAWSLDG